MLSLRGRSYGCLPAARKGRFCRPACNGFLPVSGVYAVRATPSISVSVFLTSSVRASHLARMWSRLLSFPRRQLWRARITRWGVGYPDPEMRVLDQLCDPGKLSIDVGASLGAYTLHLLAHSAAVWAFEPRAAAQAALRAMFTTPALVIRGEALSDTTGEATFTHCTTEPGRSTLAASNPISRITLV